MLDAAETWRVALPPRVQVETTLEGSLWRPRKCDIPRKSTRMFDSKSPALSFLFLSRVMILLCVGAVCSDPIRTEIS